MRAVDYSFGTMWIARKTALSELLVAHSEWRNDTPNWTRSDAGSVSARPKSSLPNYVCRVADAHDEALPQARERVGKRGEAQVLVPAPTASRSSSYMGKALGQVVDLLGMGRDNGESQPRQGFCLPELSC